MIKKLRSAILAAVCAALLAACAASDGGIVGTGNRPDCEAQARASGDCKP